MRRVIIESPFAGDTEEIIQRNLRYLRACMADCFKRGETPFASHGLYTQPGVLNDKDPDQRRLGILAGFAWRPVSHATLIYTDLGITPGMRKGIGDAENLMCAKEVPAWGRHEIEYRQLGEEWSQT